MRTLITALLATFFILPVSGAVSRADTDKGNPHGCVNPAGHTRGWCKNGNAAGNRSGNFTTISGTVVALNGDLAQFREDNGSTVTVNQSAMLGSGMGLYVGGHYALRGYWNNNLFVAQANGNAKGGYGGNGYPYPSSTASVSGIITAISNNRVTIMQGLFSSLTIDDQQAIYNGTAQNLYVGRTVTAYGYWNGNTFYATSIG